MTDFTIGHRLRQIRRERGLSQERLADTAGVSVALISQLERGAKQAPRLSTLTVLANALGIEPSDLLGNRERFGVHGGGLLGVRDILLGVGDLPGFTAEQDDTEPPPLHELAAATRRAWRMYWAGRFGGLAAILPDMVTDGRAAAAADGEPAAALLAQAYQMCACVLVHAGNDNLAAVAANRGLAAACDSGDELQYSALCCTSSWVFLHQGRHPEAERVAVRAAERIDPAGREVPPEQVTVWGGLLLTATAAAAAAGRAGEAGEYAGLAGAAVAGWPGDRHDYQVNCGPTQVAMQQCHAASVLGDGSRALEAAGRVRREDLLGISWGAHNLDVAMVLMDGRKYGEATEVLTRACEVSPEWYGHQGHARAMTGELRRVAAAPSRELRRLVAAAGI